MSRATCCLAATLSCFALHAADLPPDKGTLIPEASQRPVVVTSDSPAVATPKHTLPEGFTLSVAAAAPLVTHPIMGCVDDRGRVFVGDAVGVNWNKAQLEANPPNRVLMLEDRNGDGTFDKSTVFADKMTFPQGACWLKGSLYVCSPPGVWKLTDTDDDGVADEREMIVSGFDYTGNAADVHGPKAHPNGRLYWCHGRKGHIATQSDGKVVHEGKASGIWSCLPDGTDLKWHSLGCADNPTGLDFTTEGDVIGTTNLYYSNPRGDTLMHWLVGGVYERADQMQVIEGLPRTLERMPVIHNFGHVAVSGCAFWRAPEAGMFGGGKDAQHLMVTHFNTQRLVRMELEPEGSTYRATENEFLKLQNPDIHLTDVFQAPDGSLLVIDTGGWFRIGCPSSLMAKPDISGAIYRISPARRSPVSTPVTVAKPSNAVTTEAEAVEALNHEDPQVRLRALARVAQIESAAEELKSKLRAMMAEPLDPPLEHAVMHAARTLSAVRAEDLSATENPLALRRMLVAYHSGHSTGRDLAMKVARQNLDAADAALARVALNHVIASPAADAQVAPVMKQWLEDAEVSNERQVALSGFASAMLSKPQTQELVTRMLEHTAPEVRRTALLMLADQPGAVASVAAWIDPLRKLLAESQTATASVSAPLVLDVIKKQKNAAFDAALENIGNDAKQPLTLRLKALSAMKGLQLTGKTFDLLTGVLTADTSSSAARIQSASMLAAAPLKEDQIRALAPVLARVGPVEMKELLTLVRKTKNAELARALATELAKNPSLISQQESIYRTAFSNHPPELFEKIILPARQRAEAAMDLKKRQLAPLAEKVAKVGDAKAGKAHFAAGKGTCIACHKVADLGRAIGPDLTKIGAIRTERDLLESILFPSNTLARDYEAHILETSDGQTMMGVIRSHTAEGLLVVDVAGQEKNVAHAKIVSDTTLPTSLMPMGLDQTLPEKELLDLVAYLRSLK